jgi:hypothetical protein
MQRRVAIMTPNTTDRAVPGQENMKTLGEIGKTDRGFELIEFVDLSNHKPCTLQQSSVAIDDGPPGSSAIWLGVGDVRMHLNHEKVTALVAHLTAWVETGSFVVGDEPTADDEPKRKASVYFRATEDGVKMTIAERDGDSMGITMNLVHAAYCVQRLREETTEYKRMLRRAERAAARAAKIAASE